MVEKENRKNTATKRKDKDTMVNYRIRRKSGGKQSEATKLQRLHRKQQCKKLN